MGTLRLGDTVNPLVGAISYAFGNYRIQPQDPDSNQGVPALLPQALPVHQVIDVDLFVQGCPPPADAIHFVLSELVAGRVPDPTEVTRFGA